MDSLSLGSKALIEEQGGLQARVAHGGGHLAPAADEADGGVVEQQPLLQLLAERIGLRAQSACKSSK
jgi:hypothetical protein